jgi:polyisoprenoid-binding protein YceI
VADSFRKTGEGAYEANGNLTIKGITVPVLLPFTIKLEDVKDIGMTRARVKGSAVLDRSKFGLGKGEWADPSVIANEVTVDIDLTAYTKR